MAERNLIEVAIGLLGSEGKLAEAAGCSQVAINKAKKRVAEGGRVSAEMAVALERATKGAIPRWRLRPDLWEPPSDPHLAPQMMGGNLQIEPLGAGA